MMGSGKSAVGRALAELLGVSFIDLDQRIERMFGLTIPEAFERGEPYFRGLERDALRSLLAEPALQQRTVVVATGGGAVVDPDNRVCMDRAGRRVLLHVPPEDLAARLVGEQASGRPLVADANDPLARLRALWVARKDAYEQGAVVVDARGGVQEVAAAVAAALDLSPQTGEMGV